MVEIIYFCHMGCHDRDMCTDDYDMCPYREDEGYDQNGEPLRM